VLLSLEEKTLGCEGGKKGERRRGWGVRGGGGGERKRATASTLNFESEKKNIFKKMGGLFCDGGGVVVMCGHHSGDSMHA
jgi:hypothetical protein